MERINEPLAGLSDVPCDPGIQGLLRAVAAGDEEAASEAVQSLFETVWHQGSVYPETLPAVPFVARLAAAGHQAEAMLCLLGHIAESADEQDMEPGSARAAVIAEADLMLPLLAGPDPRVRVAAAWALARCPGVPGAVPALRAQWEADSSPVVRADLLHAVSTLDPAQGADLARRVLPAAPPGRDPGSAERLVAAWALLASGAPGTSDVTDAATAWVTVGLDLAPLPWGRPDDELFPGLLLDLAARGSLTAATDLAAAAIERASDPDVRDAVVHAARDLTTEYRVPAARLTAVLAPLAAGPEPVPAAVDLLRDLDAAPDEADTAFAAADVRGPSVPADRALARLLELGDPRAAGLLARDLGDRPQALWKAEALPFSQQLLTAIRDLLRDRRFDEVYVTPSYGEFRPGRLDLNGLIHVLGILQAWGPAAAAAVPEVTAVTEVMPLNVGRTLAAIAGPAPETVSALRTAAAPGGDESRRPYAAVELYELTGDDGPLRVLMEELLAKGRTSSSALDAAGTAALGVGTAPAWLAPAVTAALDATTRPPDRATFVHAEGRWKLARALWRATGDADRFVAGIEEALSHGEQGLGRIAGPAAEAAHDLGTAAAPLVPALLRLLGDPWRCPEAARAILAADPAGTRSMSTEDLAGHLMNAIDSGIATSCQRSLELLGEIARRRPAAVTATIRERLAELAERPRRIVDNPPLDEALRARIRDFLAH